MANYKKITDVEVMEGVTENSMALVNENGVLKQVSCGAGFGGGGGGVKTAIIKQDDYDDALSGVSAAIAITSYTCTNMTFDDAVSVIMSGEPLNVILQSWTDRFEMCTAQYVGYQASGTPCISMMFTFNEGSTQWHFWTADGISEDDPNAPL